MPTGGPEGDGGLSGGSGAVRIIQAARTGEHDDQASRLWRACRKKNVQPATITVAELEDQGAGQLVTKLCIFATAEPIPVYFDKGLCCVASTLVGYVGKYLKHMRNIYPNHPDWVNLGMHESPPWWTALRTPLMNKAKNNEIRWQGNYEFGTGDIRPLYLYLGAVDGDNPLKFCDLKHSIFELQPPTLFASAVPPVAAMFAPVTSSASSNSNNVCTGSSSSNNATANRSIQSESISKSKSDKGQEFADVLEDLAKNNHFHAGLRLDAASIPNGYNSKSKLKHCLTAADFVGNPDDIAVLTNEKDEDQLQNTASRVALSVYKALEEWDMKNINTTTRKKQQLSLDFLNVSWLTAIG